MQALARTLLRLKRDESGVALIFALLIMLAVLSGLLLDASLISSEYRTARMEQSRAELRDSADFTDGFVASVVTVAKAASSPTPLTAAPGSSDTALKLDVAGHCFNIWLDAHVVYETDAANCSTAPSSTRTLATGVTNTNDEPLFSYYLDATPTSPSVGNSPSGAKSFDITLHLAAPNGSYPFQSTYHVVLSP